MKPIIAIAIMIPLFFLIGCHTAGAGSAETAAEASETVELETLDGKTMRLQDLRGQVVLLDFWASWCATCKRSMPFYAELQQRYADRGLTIVAVSVDDTREDLEDFLRDNPGFTDGLLHAWDRGHEAVERFNPEAIPTLYLLDREGNVHDVHAGFEPEARDDITARVETLVAR